MEMDDMFFGGEEDDVGGSHDGDDNHGDDDDVVDEDYIPSASERYKPTDEPCTDEDMDILQLAGAEVEMVEDIGSLAQSLGASHLGRSLKLQAEMKHPSLAAQQTVGNNNNNRPGGLLVGSGAACGEQRRDSSGLASAMAQAPQSNIPSFNYRPPVSAPRLDSFKMIKERCRTYFGD